MSTICNEYFGDKNFAQLGFNVVYSVSMTVKQSCFFLCFYQEKTYDISFDYSQINRSFYMVSKEQKEQKYFASFQRFVHYLNGCLFNFGYFSIKYISRFV